MTAPAVEVPAQSRYPAVPDGYVVASDMLRAGMTYRQLDYWSRTDVLRPAPSKLRGSGYPRIWPAEELAVGAAVVRLLTVGLDLKRAAELARREIPPAGEPIVLPTEVAGVFLLLRADLWDVPPPPPPDPE